MKMVSAAKFGRAERELKPARGFGGGASGKIEFLAELSFPIPFILYLPFKNHIFKFKNTTNLSELKV